MPRCGAKYQGAPPDGKAPGQGARQPITSDCFPADRFFEGVHIRKFRLPGSQYTRLAVACPQMLPPGQVVSCATAQKEGRQDLWLEHETVREDLCLQNGLVAFCSGFHRMCSRNARVLSKVESMSWWSCHWKISRYKSAETEAQCRDWGFTHFHSKRPQLNPSTFFFSLPELHVQIP